MAGEKDAKDCQLYSDSFISYPDAASAAQRQAIDKENRQKVQLYLAVRNLLSTRFGFSEAIPAPPHIPPAAGGLDNVLGAMTLEGRVYFVSVVGILLTEGFSDPLLNRPARLVAGPEDVSFEDNANQRHIIARGFVEEMVKAVQEVQGSRGMFTAVYSALATEGTVIDGTRKKVTIVARQLAEVTRQLVAQGVDPQDPQLNHMVGDALSAVLGQTLEGRFSATDIDLPDLEEGSEADVLPDNVRALSAVYFSAMLEELKFFAVADKVVEQFVNGMVPISRGTAGDALYDYFKNAPNRLTEVERRGLYARAFGLAQGSVEEPMPNREFSDLWIRFLSGVNLLSRQSSSERLVVTNEYVFKNARDLAVNLSLHGYGALHFTAVELQKLVKDVKKMLSFGDILNAYGVRDYNQLIERVSTLYLGGSVNGVRQRTMAQTGAAIIQWISDRARILSSASEANKIRFAPDSSGTPEALEITLAGNVDRWLAVNGTPDSTVDRYAEPVAVTQQPTIPSMFSSGDMPDALRDAMSKMGNLTGGMNGAAIGKLPQA